MKTLISVLPLATLLLLGGCASYQPTLATPSFDPSTVAGFSVKSPSVVEITDGRQAWNVHLVGRCLELGEATGVVFTDEQAISHWPDQPWRHGYGEVAGWPLDGQVPDRSSSHMRVSSNRLSWLHAYNDDGLPVQSYASYGCQVEEVEPLWR